jgi:fatty-acid desaturase
MTNRLVSFTTILLGCSFIASIVFCVLLLSYYVVGVDVWCGYHHLSSTFKSFAIASLEFFEL